MKTSRTVIAVALCMTAFAPVCAAQPSAKMDAEVEALTDKARQLFMEGLDALKRGRWAEAHAALLAAFRIKPHPQIASNLGAAEIKLGKHREAAEHLSYYLREAPKTKEKERQRARALLDEALAKVASVTLRGTLDGAEVKVDGAAVGRAPLAGALFLEPGAHTIEAAAEGFPVARAAIEVKAGEVREVEIVLARAAPPPPPKEPERRSMVPGFMLGGAAIAGLATGAGLLAAGGAKRSAADEVAKAILATRHSCVAGAPNLDPRCAEVKATTSTSDKLHNAGVGVLIGGAALAAAATLYFVWPSPKVTATPVVGPSGAGLWVHGSF